MNSSKFDHQDTLSWTRAGFKNRAEMELVIQTIEDTSNLLEDTWKVKINYINIKTLGRVCTAHWYTYGITMRLQCLAHWSDKGFAEYATVQYLIGNKWRRGKPKQYSKLVKGFEKATTCIVAHEYAHLVTGMRYGIGIVRPHGIEFQILYADMLDQVFPDFGAVDRLFKKKTEQIDIVMYREGIG